MLIQSVSKALHLLSLINKSGVQGLSLVEAASQLGQKVPTVFNLLATLESEGYVERDATSRHYVLGHQAWQLGVRQPFSEKISSVLRPHLEALSSRLHETLLVTQLVSGKRHTILGIESSELQRVAIQCSADERFYDTATGRMMLAELPPTQQRELCARLSLPGSRWSSIDNMEALLGALAAIHRVGHVDYRLASGGKVRALAVPLRLSCTVPVALGMFYHTDRHPDDASALLFLAQMKECADSIEKEWSCRYGEKLSLTRKEQ